MGWVSQRQAGLATRRTLLASVLVCAPAFAAEEPSPDAAPDGRALMEAVDTRPRGADQTLEATWRLQRGGGRERVRRTRTLWRDARTEDDGVHSKRLIVFEAPADVKDTGFLVVSRLAADEDDQRWIYLPALRKVRRVASGDRGKSFVGTEFSYEDLAERGVDEDTHRWLRSDTIDGVPHEVIESSPRDEGFPYARRVQWIDPEARTVSRIEYYDRPDRHAKTLHVVWQEVDDVRVWKTLRMENHRKQRETRVEVTAATVNDGHPDDLFSESTLRYGVP